MTLRWITPLVHPASVMRGRPALAPVQVAHLKRLAQDPHPTAADISQLPPGFEPDPSLEDLRTFCQLARACGVIVLDIENAGPHLVCCGVGRLYSDTLTLPEVRAGVCWRFRRAGGAPWWPTFDEHLEAVTLLDGLLSDRSLLKVGHFTVQHDFPLLVDLGFDVQPPYLDTSALCHAAHSELRKGLQFLATAFLGAPRWKDIPDEKDGGETDTAEGVAEE